MQNIVDASLNKQAHFHDVYTWSFLNQSCYSYVQQENNLGNYTCAASTNYAHISWCLTLKIMQEGILVGIKGIANSSEYFEECFLWPAETNNFISDFCQKFGIFYMGAEVKKQLPTFGMKELQSSR